MQEQPKTTATYRRILDAAIQVFAEKGYHNARMDDIVEAAESSKGSVYFHFSSKEQIFLAILDLFARRLERGIQEAIQAQSGGVPKLDAALQACLEVFSKYGGLAKIFLVQAAGLGSTVETKRLEITAHFSRLIQGYLEQAIQEGELAPVDTEITAAAWVGAIYEVVIRWMLTGRPDLEQSMPVLRTFLLRSVGIDPNALTQENPRA